MKQNPTDDELRRYLLGQLPEPQAADLEERILKEDDLFDLVEGVEADLLAAASRGELAPAERERVLRRLAFSPEGRERLALAHSLNTLADDATGTRKEMAPVVPFHPRVGSPKPRFQWAALAAAGLLAATGLFWYTQQTPQGGVSAPQVAHERSAPANPVPPAVRDKEPTPATAPPVSVPPRGTVEPLAEKGETARQKDSEPVKAILALALTTLRDASQEQTLHLPAGTRTAEIQIDLEGMEDAGPFHAVVRGKDRETVWEKSGLEPRKLTWGTALVLDVPADRLSGGWHEVAITSSAEPEEITQEFNVVRENR